MSVAKAKKAVPGSATVQPPSFPSRSQAQGPGSRIIRKRKHVLMPAALAFGGGMLFQQTTLTAFSLAVAVVALAAAPALWQLSRRIRRFSHSRDGEMTVDFEGDRET